jgi:hypothetical protein
MTSTASLPKYIRLHCASYKKVLGWRESRDDTRWILVLCDNCYDKKDRAEHERRTTKK